MLSAFIDYATFCEYVNIIIGHELLFLVSYSVSILLLMKKWDVRAVHPIKSTFIAFVITDSG